MARRRKDVLRLRLLGQLLGENLALDVGVWTDVRDGQGDSFAHDLSIQVLALDLFLLLSREEFDWVWVGPIGRLVRPLLHVALVIDQMVVVDNYSRKVFAKFELEGRVVAVVAGGCGEGVSRDVDHVDGLGHGQEPHAALVVDQVKRHVYLL